MLKRNFEGRDIKLRSDIDCGRDTCSLSGSGRLPLLFVAVLLLIGVGCEKKASSNQGSSNSKISTATNTSLALENENSGKAPKIVENNLLGSGSIEDWAAIHGGIPFDQGPNDWCRKKDGCNVYYRWQNHLNASEGMRVWTKNGKIAGVIFNFFNIHYLSDVAKYADKVGQLLAPDELPTYISKLKYDHQYVGHIEFPDGLLTLESFCPPVVVGSEMKTPPFKNCYVIKMKMWTCKNESSGAQCSTAVPESQKRHDLPY